MIIRDLKDSFKFKAGIGETVYSAVKGNGSYTITWEGDDLQDSGTAHYLSHKVCELLESGTWRGIQQTNDELTEVISKIVKAEYSKGDVVEPSSTDGWTLQTDGNFSVSGIGLGVARPVLETRKIGKNRIELVDKGFPNALWEIARLMTKAQEVKQYSDHDWKKLPIDTFSSAASRHRMKTNMGEIYDDEFAADGFEIRHKVNEAFNVLAELELLLEQDKVK